MWTWTSLLTLSVIALTPTPKEISVDLEEHFFFKADTMVVLSDAYVPEREALLSPINSLLGGQPRVAPASQVEKVATALYVATVAHPGALEKRKLRRYLEGSERLPAAGYQLTIGDSGIVLVGADEPGLWYGLQALAGLAKEYGSNLPYLKIRDWPALSFRGAYTRSMPTPREVERLSAMRATHLFIASEDFYDLYGVRAEAWRVVFELVRAAHLEPVPVFSTLDGMEKILRDYPMLIEGRHVTEQLSLSGATSRELRYPNILAESPEDIRVTISGVPCSFGSDYFIEGPAIQAPFHPDGPRWRIWRELEGVIPDGGTVTVTYSIATADSSSLAYGEPRAWQWLEARLGELVTVLHPRFIHFDHGQVGRINTDSRSLDSGLSNSDRFVQSLSVLTSLLQDVDGGVEPLIWADLINPSQGAATYGLLDVAAQLPERIRPLGRVTVKSTVEAQTWYSQLRAVVKAPMIIAVDGAPGGIQALVNEMAAGGGASKGGLIAMGEAETAVDGVLAAAWRGGDGGGIWMDGLNAYFGADLVQPDYRAVQGALVRYVNEKTLAGESPDTIHATYQGFVVGNPTLLSQDKAGAEQISALFALLTTYLNLEERYARRGDTEALRALLSVVEDLEALDPAPAVERYQRIRETIEKQALFVPASILFQEDLRYYRPGMVSHPLIEVPILPVYADRAGEVGVSLDLLTGQAPIARIDFEALGLQTLRLEGHGGGGDFSLLEAWGDGDAMVRGAVLVTEPVARPALRLNGVGDGSALVLRDVRLFAASEPATMKAHYAIEGPPMVPMFSDRAWSKAIQGHSFLRRGAIPSFAEAPTAIRVSHTRDALYFGIDASEPRPETTVADLIERDGPLWEQESVALWIQRAGKMPLRLMVSPLGTQYDSEAFDGGWNGDWTAVAAPHAHGWSAVIRVPMALLDPIKRGTKLAINVVRYRHGVVEEESAWAHAYGAQPDLQWGTLEFP